MHATVVLHADPAEIKIHISQEVPLSQFLLSYIKCNNQLKHSKRDSTVWKRQIRAVINPFAAASYMLKFKMEDKDSWTGATKGGQIHMTFY